MKKFLMFVANIVLISSSAIAAQSTCPAGCFCLNNGNFNLSETDKRYCGIPATPKPHSAAFSVCHNWIAYRDFPGPTPTYYAEDFSELYEGYFGAYGFINGNFIYINQCWTDVTENPNGIFQCSLSHPSSDSGAKTIVECYRITANGQKEYYTHTNTQNNYSGNYDINALMQNLQSALNQANTAAQNLQNALNSPNLANTTQSQTATTLNNTNTITKMTNAQTFVSPTSAPTTTTKPQTTTTQSTTATPTTVAPVTMKLSDVKTDSTTPSPLKKLDFGNLSSIFSADKAAVHNTATGRAALPTTPPRVSHIKKSSPIRATTNGATSTPPQTNTAPAPTRANTKTKRIASER